MYMPQDSKWRKSWSFCKMVQELNRASNSSKACKPQRQGREPCMQAKKDTTMLSKVWNYELTYCTRLCVCFLMDISINYVTVQLFSLAHAIQNWEVWIMQQIDRCKQTHYLLMQTNWEVGRLR
jgi:hypothetical protein